MGEYDPFVRGPHPAGVRTADFNMRPIGSGPFRFVEHRANDRWVFERVEEFPDDLGRPAIDRFVVAVVDESSPRWNAGHLRAVELGDVHVCADRNNPRVDGD